LTELQTRPACRELQAFVRVYAQREISRTGTVVVCPAPPRLEQTLEFQFGEKICFAHTGGARQDSSAIMVVGAITEWGAISLPAGAISFGVFFQPGGFSRIFGIPMAELSRHAYDATAVVGRMVDSLGDQLAASGSFAERVVIVEEFLLKRAARLSRSTPIEDATARVFAVKGSVRVGEIALHYGLGLRQFERRFLEHTGIQPKVYARIARFQSALDAKISAPRRPWLDIAHSLGYHDQMHMVREFHELAGDAPGKIFSSIGSMRPPANEAAQKNYHS